MLNDKRGLSTYGFLLMFIGIIVGLTLIVAVAQSTSTLADTVNAVNTTVTTTGNYSQSGSYQYLTGQELIGTPTVTNASGYTVGSGNYTVTEVVRDDTGVKGIKYQNLNGLYNSTKISYTYGADGYVEDSSSRTIVTLVIIFLALGLLAYVMWASGLFEQMRDWF